MNEKDILSVPYIVYESSVSRLERTIKRLFILIILLILCLVGTNVAWTIYNNEYETIRYDQSERTMEVIDDLMQTIKATQPRLYASVMRKMQGWY